MKTQRIVILLLVLGLVVGLELVLMTRCTGEPSAAARPTATPAATDEPAAATPTVPPPAAVNTRTPGVTSPPDNVGGSTQTQTQQSATRAPEATRAPASSTATPAPTAPPTEPPAPAGTVTASNSFSSNTGVGLNMNVSWTATDMGNGTTRLSITGTVNSYELHVMSLPVSISFSGYSASLMGSSINAGSGGMQSNNLFTTSMDVASGTAGTMTVTWNFNGEYSSTPISTITASDFVYTD